MRITLIVTINYIASDCFPTPIHEISINLRFIKSVIIY